MNVTQAKRVALYARVSTRDKGQDPEAQLAPLRDWCARAGHEIIAEYVEHESGRKGLAARTALSELLADGNKRLFDLVVFWSLDRFSREGMAKTVGYLQRLDAAGVSFHSYTEEMLSTDNEVVRDILIAVMATLARQEAVRISERTKAGLARARARGKVLGRPGLDQTIAAKIRAAKAQDPTLSVRALAAHFGISTGKVSQLLRSSKTD